MHVSPNQTLTIAQQLEVSGVADIIQDDGGIDSLMELINSDFDMSVDDPDYGLSMDELIKACKILFHKINYNNKRSKLQINEAQTKMTD